MGLQFSFGWHMRLWLLHLLEDCMFCRKKHPVDSKNWNFNKILENNIIAEKWNYNSNSWLSKPGLLFKKKIVFEIVLDF